MRKVFLDNLPRKGGRLGKIDWKNSVGYEVPFIYDDVEGKIEIVDYNKGNRTLTILFNDDEYNIANNALYKCKIGKIIGKRTVAYKNGELLMEADSASELAIKMTEKFGEKFQGSSISSVCTGKLKTYKNIFFKYKN